MGTRNEWGMVVIKGSVCSVCKNAVGAVKGGKKSRKCYGKVCKRGKCCKKVPVPVELGMGVETRIRQNHLIHNNRDW